MQDSHTWQRDALFAQPLDQVASFSFDEQVVRVFPDMIQRSVPGYSQIVGMIGVIAQKYAQKNTHIYDLGCSLGAATLATCQHLPAQDYQWVAVDNAPAMVASCRQTLAQHCPEHPVEVLEADIQTLSLQPASVVILIFTLQFIAPPARAALLTKLAQALVPGGVLILSEKVHFADEQASWQPLMYDLHHDFKRANGYSDLEISQKRSALEDVLCTDTLTTHLQRLHQVGFQQAGVWFQYLNFASLLAIK